jgi:hypothetical protein
MKSNVIHLPTPVLPTPPPPAWSWRSILSRTSALLTREAWRRSARAKATPAVALAPRRPRRPARVISLGDARARLRPAVALPVAAAE